MTRRGKQVGALRKTLASNVVRLMEQRYRDRPNKPMELAKAAGVTLSTVQRTIGAKTGASVDTVEMFAKVFGVQPFELLIPRRRL